MRQLSHNLLPPAAAEDYFASGLFFLILLRKIRKNRPDANVYFMALRAKLYFEGLCKKVFAAFDGRILF